MKDSQLEKMTYQELIQLRDKIVATISVRQAQEKATMRQKMKQMADEAGFSLDELVGGSSSGRGRKAGSGTGSVAVKYRHPDDPTLTWTGRGRKPKWLSEAGGNIERFRVG